MTEFAVVITLTALVAAAAAVFGAKMLLLVRARSLRYPVVIVTAAPVVAAALTVGTEARLGFLRGHDIVVVLVALAGSLVVAGTLGDLVVRTVTLASWEVRGRVRQLVDDSTATLSDTWSTKDPQAPAMPGELAGVVTEVALTRGALTSARVRERTAEQSRQELMSFLSHDLRTPLAGLRALAEGLEDGVIVDLPRALSHLSSTVERMSGLVDDLFTLSRVQGAPAPKLQRMVSLTEVITEVATELASTAAARKVDVVVDIPAADRLAVLGSPQDLSRALMNLVANAVRHTDPGLTVRLSGQRAENGGVQIAIVDACGGIPDESLPHVFDTGWRGSPLPLGEHGGAGLGLAIARGVVESHSGEIAVRNVQGGCRFQVDLPSSDRAAATRS